MKVKLSDFVEALDNQFLIFRGFHIDLKDRVRISLWILLLAPSSLLQKILFCFSGNWVGYFYIWLSNMTTKEHIRNGFTIGHSQIIFVRTFCQHRKHKSWQNIFPKISFDDLRICLLITAQTTEKFGGCRSSSGVYDFSLGFLNRGDPFTPQEHLSLRDSIDPVEIPVGTWLL